VKLFRNIPTYCIWSR